MRATGSTVGAFVCAASFAACATHTIYDTYGVPVRNPLVTATVENGWLAVDSTDTGIRAVVELQLESASASQEYVELHVPRLHCTVTGDHVPARLLREPPRCRARSIGTVACAPDVTPEECDRLRQQEEQVCIYTIRAEFLFAEMPHLSENTHFFTFAQTDAPVNWVVADRDD